MNSTDSMQSCLNLDSTLNSLRWQHLRCIRFAYLWLYTDMETHFHICKLCGIYFNVPGTSSLTCLPPLCCPVFQTAPGRGRMTCFPLDWPRCCALGCCQPTLSLLLLHLQGGGWWHRCAASESATWPRGWCRSPGACATLCAGLRHCSSRSVRCWGQIAPTTGCHQSAWCEHLVGGPIHTHPSASWRTSAPACVAQWSPPTPVCRRRGQNAAFSTLTQK